MIRARATRRRFLKTTAACTGLAAVPYFWSSSSAQQESANDRLHVGAIGTSIYTDRYTGKGEHAGRNAVIGHEAAKLGNMVAVADVNLRHAHFFAKEYDGRCEVYQDYRQLLERKDIDAVTISAGGSNTREDRLPIGASIFGRLVASSVGECVPPGQHRHATRPQVDLGLGERRLRR